jgi:peptidoglycan/LPS O-acetylase OafA/YrhL
LILAPKLVTVFRPERFFSNIAATPTSIFLTASKSRKPLTLVYLVTGILAFATAAALELGGMRSPEVADAGAAPFILAAVAGALAAWVASFGAGVLGGLLTGFAYALGGGLVQAVAGTAGTPLPRILAALLLMTMIGALLGALGALPFGILRWREEQRRARRYHISSTWNEQTKGK